MRVLICGSRTMPKELGWMAVTVLRVEKATEVIAGGARGADALGWDAAMSLRLPCRTFLADWDKYGKAAGPIRNQQMLDEGKPDLVVAFYPKTGITKGTADMVRRAEEAGVRVRRIPYGTR